MLENYLKTAYRYLFLNKLNSFINITGLAAGITCTLLAVLYWKDEHSFDKFHKNNPHLFRITTTLRSDKEGNRTTTGGTGQVQGPAFKAEVPEVKNYVRILGGDIYVNLISGDKTLHVRPLFVDSSFFDVFTFTVLKGNPATALRGINSVIITESTAKKFFNSTDAVGKTFTMESDPSYEQLNKPLIISAVVKDPPLNSSLQFDVLFTFAFMHLSFEDTNWLNTYLGTFVVLDPSANLRAVTGKFNKIYAVHSKEQLKDLNSSGYVFDPEIKYGLQPMTEIHLGAGITPARFNEGGVANISNPAYSYSFMGIALIILLLATINFINISIAGSSKRSKEVGLRKISGASTIQIILQFLIESAILCLISFLLSFLLMNLLLPVFNSVTGKHLYLSDVIDGKLLAYFFIVLSAVILFNGLYPAFILSKFKATKVLYNRQKLNSRNFFGRGLVIFQFSIAVFLLITTIVYYRQMDYMRTKDLGYNPSNMIRTEVDGDRDYKRILSHLKNEFEKTSSIEKVSFGNDGRYEDVEVDGHTFRAMNKGIDENYVSMMQIPLLSGSNVSGSIENKTGQALVNQAFVKAAGLQQPLNQLVLINRHYDSAYKRIAGIVKDFNFSSLRETIQPLILSVPESADGSAGIWVKFTKSNQKKALAAVQRIYKSVLPHAVYQFSFVDELNAAEYLQEQRWQKVINLATVLAFVLCCLGLFGLSHLSINQRTKEIGVRKVLGASVGRLTVLLSFNFLKLVVISVMIAVPAALLVSHEWLQNYAYRIDISWWMFALAAVFAILVALITIGFRSISAAIANPVNSLRTE